MTQPVTTFANGARAIVVNRPHTQGVSVAVFVNTGSSNETKELNGISHFLEHMAFKGTSRRNYMQISQDVERLGADINAYTSKETTAYYVSGLAKHTGIFIDLISDILLHSELPENEIEQERGVIIQEYNMRNDSAGSIAWDLYDNTSFGKSSYGRSILGPKGNIERFKRDDFLGYIKRQYTGPNIIIGVAGNVDEAETLKLIEEAFSGIASGKTNVVKPPEYKGGIAIKRKAAFKQTKVLMGFPGASMRGNYFTDLVAASVIGGGMSSPLFNEIREKRSLAYSVSSGFSNSGQVGQFYISAGTSAEHLDEYFKATCGVLKDIAVKIDPVDLERAQNGLAVNVSRTAESRFSLLESYAEELFTYNETRDFTQFTDAIMNVTADQVSARVAELITKQPTIAIVGKGGEDRFLDLVKDNLR